MEWSDCTDTVLGNFPGFNEICKNLRIHSMNLKQMDNISFSVEILRLLLVYSFGLLFIALNY